MNLPLKRLDKMTDKKCEFDGCQHAATHSVTLNIPAKGVPIDLHAPIKMYVGVELCADHAKEFGKGFSWDDNEPLRSAIEATLRTTGRTDADFERSFHSTIRLSDPGYVQFLEMSASRKANNCNS